MIKLNLGCGAKLMEGFVNVDLANNWCETPPDVVADVRVLPFPDDYADEVHAYHVFEHFYRWESEAMLQEWIRVLKPNGLLVLEMPCLDKVLALFDYYHRKQKPLNPAATMYALYGDPNYNDESMCHRWCYSVAELGQMMADNGLDVEEKDPQTHIKVRDMRLEGIKRGLIQLQ